jgi:hypothetical protein
VNPGGEPERDEYGLPPVDIEIPDDARELDRDVQAYHRELRAERRRQRRRRLHLSLARDGIVLPLLACCLILALITGTLLTVFTATSGQELPPRPGTSKPADNHKGTSRAPSSANSPGSRTSPGTGGRSSRSSSPSTQTAPSKPRASSGAAAITPGPYVKEVSDTPPAGNLTVAGHSISLKSLSGAMLILLTSDCRCAEAVSWLADAGFGVHALVFIVSTPGMPGTSAEANHYEAQLNSLSSAVAGTVSEATDTQGVLYTNFPPLSQLTAVLIGAHSNAVYYAYQLGPGESSAPLIRALES